MENVEPEADEDAEHYIIEETQSIAAEDEIYSVVMVSGEGASNNEN